MKEIDEQIGRIENKSLADDSFLLSQKMFYYLKKKGLERNENENAVGEKTQRETNCKQIHK